MAADRGALEARLLAALDREPPRAGFHHSGEAILRAASRDPGTGFPAWLEELLCRDSLDPGDRADILRLASRLGLPIEAGARQRLAGRALATESVDLRDAATQAAEHWNDRALAALLRARADKEPVPWLKRYMEGVAADLEE